VVDSKLEIMIERNLSSILVMIAMILNIFNFRNSNINIDSANFWLLIGSILVLIAALLRIFYTENKKNKKSSPD